MKPFREPVKVPLECPVESFGVMIDSVTISRHATGRDREEVEALDEWQANLKYIELLCGVPMDTVRGMFQGDIEEIVIRSTPFVHRIPKTGESSKDISPADVAGPQI